MKTTGGICSPFLIICSLVLAGGFSPSAAAELLTLVPVAGKDYRASLDPVKVRLGSEMPVDMIPYLRLEIDAIDVTGFVQFDAQMLTYTPPQPLTAGQHQLRIVAVLPDGSIEEAAIWTIEVRASKAFRVASINGQLDIQAVQRVTDNLGDSSVGRTQGQGAVTLASQHADEDWSVTSRANMLYNSQATQTLTGKEFDLTDYQVNSVWTQGSVTLGHQTLPLNSLVLNGFSRRGLSASAHTVSNAIQFTAFGARTEEIAGFNHITGLDDSDRLTSGVILTGYPLETRPERLAITGVYLDGRGTGGGVAQVNDITNNVGGRAQAVIVDSYLHNKLWRIRGEHATSSFDFDGVNTGYGAINDDATTLLLGYDTAREDGPAAQASYNWGISVIRQRVGPWFYSLGNITNTVDRETTQLTGYYQGTEFGINGNISLGEDNVDEINTLPTTSIETASFNLSYVPGSTAPVGEEPEQGNNPLQGLFSNPAYTLSWTQNNLDQIKTPVAYNGDDVNSHYDELTLAATFSGSDWYWSLSHALIKQDDRVNAGNSTRTVNTALDSQLTLNEYLSVTPVLQHSETDYRNLNTRTRSWLAGAAFNLDYPENWNNSFSYTVNRETASDDSVDTRTRIAEMTLQWHYQKASQNRAGVSLFTTGSHRQIEASGTETKEYQVFVGINIALPANF